MQRQLASIVLAVVLMVTGIALAATGAGPPLPTPIAPFGCGA